MDRLEIKTLHLTRPPVEIPDRAALGMPSHFKTAKGAYVVRDYDAAQPKGGVLIVQAPVQWQRYSRFCRSLQRRS